MAIKKVPKSKKSNVIKVSNSLIEAFVKKNNLTALKLIFYIANSEIQILDSSIITLRINTKDFTDYCNIDLKTLQRNIKQMTETSISIIDDKSESYITIIPYAKFEYGGKMELKIFPEILRLVKEVRNKFTIIDVKEIMQLNSKHSVRMLAILEMIEGFDQNIAKRKYYEFEELNLMFGTNYKRMGQFEKEILEPAKKELDSTSKISFIYEIKYDKQSATVGRARAAGATIDLIKNVPQGKLF